MSLIYKIQRVNSILMSLLSVCGVKSSSIPKRVLSIDHRKVLTAREPLSISFLNHSTNFMHRYFILLILRSPFYNSYHHTRSLEKTLPS